MHVSVERGTVAGLLVALVAATAVAQKTTQLHPGAGGSPHVRTDWTIAGANISIEYGRPYLKGRIIGKDVEPMAGRVWRVGADEATVLRTDVPLAFGNVMVAAGSYTLWMLTEQDGSWRLIVNRQTKGLRGALWGTEYSETEDFARISMKVEKLDRSIEQLMISIDKAANGGLLAVEWGSIRASAPFAVRKTS